MSGASSNAAARRRRAAPPSNVSRISRQPPSQNTLQSHDNTTQHLSNNVSLEGLPTKNGRAMHPLEILKIFNGRINKLENNLSANDINESENYRTIMLNYNNEIEKLKTDALENINETVQSYKKIESLVSEKLSIVERKVKVVEDQMEELKELCSKIQTFSMETNMSFMLFKNEYDKQKEENNSFPFMNVLNQMNNYSENESFDETSIVNNIVIDEDYAEDNQLEVEDIELEYNSNNGSEETDILNHSSNENQLNSNVEHENDENHENDKNDENDEVTA